MRGQSERFLSFGTKVTRSESTGSFSNEQSLFFEYGLRPRLTLGLRGLRNDDDAKELEAFARFPLGRTDRRSQFALQFGLGNAMDGSRSETFVTGNLNWGRGLEIRASRAWAGVDTQLRVPLTGSEATLKVDGTFGVTLSNRWQVMAQGFIEASETISSFTLAPSVMLRSRSKKTRLVVGLEQRFGDFAGTSARISIWRNF